MYVLPLWHFMSSVPMFHQELQYSLYRWRVLMNELGLLYICNIVSRYERCQKRVDGCLLECHPHSQMQFCQECFRHDLYWWTLIVYHLMFSPTDVTSYGLWLFRISTIILPSVFIINIVIIILIGYLSFVAQHISNDRAQRLTLSQLSSCRVGKRVINFPPCIGKMKMFINIVKCEIAWLQG